MKQYQSFSIISVTLALGTAFTLFGCNAPQNEQAQGGSGTCTQTNALSAQVVSAKAAKSIPPITQTFTDLGAIDTSQTLPVTIALNLKNEADLNQRIAEIYQPGNPNFHRYLTPDEFRATYTPDSAQITEAKNLLLEQGFESISVNPNGYLITANATVAAVNAAFQTEIHQYRSANGNQYFAPASEPVIPAGHSIQAVHGLHNITHFRSYAHLSLTAGTAPRSGSGPNQGLSPSDIKGAYSLPSNLDGTGQTLALFELDGYTASDISTYGQAFGIPQLNIQNIFLDGSTGSAGSGAAEVTLDIELMGAIAPKGKILVYEGPNTSQSVLDVYAKIANDNLASQVSTSWGSPEAEVDSNFLKTENTIFAQMAAQGQTIYAASGDQGAYDNSSTLSVDDPASQPYMVGVGGTQLNVSSSTYQSESTWNGGSISGGAGGGGISTVWQIPSWQSAISPGSNSASSVSKTMRNVPDVSLNADPSTGYAIYLGGSWQIYGGTSAAAPLWAAFTALVNEQRVSSGLSALGFANPFFYTLGAESQYGSDFHDIQSGTNLYYPATQGYDNATGWGSFKGQGLLHDLSLDPLSTPPSPPQGC